MSNFQLALVITFGVILALYVGFNTWSARRNEPKKPKPEEVGGALPVGEDDARFEPGFDGKVGGATGDPVLDAQLGGQGPRLGGNLGGNASADAFPAGAVARSGNPGTYLGDRQQILDALTDAIAPVHTDGIVSGNAAIAAMPSSFRAGNKAFNIEGMNQATQTWELPKAGERYTGFQAGIQLANRHGPMNEIEFSEFVGKVQQFADTIGASPDLPDMLQEVARARELDAFASEHDAQLAFMLRAKRASWSPGYVAQVAAKHGFVPAGPGRMVMPSSIAQMPSILALTYDAQAALADDPEQSALRDVLLSLDVPHVSRSEAPFDKMRAAAEALCAEMDGVICDQNGTPLPVMVVDPIAQDLENLYDQLEERELAAGSLAARRLFS
ncbi:cell division protein ZipA C-terminal FtsZ-binding domain-containing protein [Comamonas sp. 4034]|uniref:cell division protein ZipA C-terminal FtsZ-binding domain-containing protein n=1 Tax=Comamonas sp. 4034 TaxID=3156455 RepID=UPI003D24D49B